MCTTGSARYLVDSSDVLCLHIEQLTELFGHDHCLPAGGWEEGTREEVRVAQCGCHGNTAVNPCVYTQEVT